MLGPDLTSQLAWVLPRFCTEEVASVGDLETMYYQVQVPEGQRSVLRFLQWEDGNLGGDVLDHEMCLHDFNCTFCSGCCNYVL